MYNVTFSKVAGGTNVRTKTTTGHCYNLPVVGAVFEMFSNPLNKNADIRWITTSTVQNIVDDTDCMLIETMNSTYKLVVA
jgi:hypothetical protein